MEFIDCSKNVESLKRRMSKVHITLLSVILLGCNYAYSQATAKIENIWQTHHVVKDNEQGMNIHIKFSFTDMLNKTGRCSVYFYSATGSVLEDTNQRFRSANGQVSTGVPFTPNITDGIYNNFVLFIPYAELHLPSGRHDIKFDVTIFDDNRQPITQSDFQECQVDWSPPIYTPPSQNSLQQTMQSQTQSQNEKQNRQIYLGLGMGLDYGGLGVKIELLPVKYFGLFVGLGYNLVSCGWNIGVTYKIQPDDRISPNLMFFYGYNAVLIDRDYRYGITSYGITIGGNMDFKVGSSGSKWSVGLFVPFRSKQFLDSYDSNSQSVLWPILFSVGYNF